MTQNNINIGNHLINFASSKTFSTFAISSGIPFDDTIPQNTEGVEVLTCSITPSSASSTLVITASFPAKPDVGSFPNRWIASIFQDSNANALTTGNARVHNVNILKYVMTAGTTSSTTFKLRVGPPSGGTNKVYINADVSGNPIYGGVSYVLMTIEEYL